MITGYTFTSSTGFFYSKNISEDGDFGNKTKLDTSLATQAFVNNDTKEDEKDKIINDAVKDIEELNLSKIL